MSVPPYLFTTTDPLPTHPMNGTMTLYQNPSSSFDSVEVYFNTEGGRKRERERERERGGGGGNMIDELFV